MIYFILGFLLMFILAILFAPKNMKTIGILRVWLIAAWAKLMSKLKKKKKD